MARPTRRPGRKRQRTQITADPLIREEFDLVAFSRGTDRSGLFEDVALAVIAAEKEKLRKQGKTFDDVRREWFAARNMVWVPAGEVRGAAKKPEPPPNPKPLSRAALSQRRVAL